MPEPVIPIPYKIRCGDCKDPARFHDMSGCRVENCKCKGFQAEELEHELCMDAATGKQICVTCSSDKDLKDGLCKECRDAKST